MEQTPAKSLAFLNFAQFLSILTEKVTIVVPTKRKFRASPKINTC